MPKITYERVHELFNYDGKYLIWRKKIGKRTKKDTIAGCIASNGYRNIKINYKSYPAHLLIWFFHYGYFPENDIDHKNRIRADNRLKNLREVSRSCNIRNIDNFKNNTSGVKGVCFFKPKNRWLARIYFNKKYHYIGRFKNFDEAVLYRYAVEQCLDWEKCNAMSPAHKYVLKNKLIHFYKHEDIKKQKKYSL